MVPVLAMAGDSYVDDRLFDLLFRAQEFRLCHAGAGGGIRHYQQELWHYPVARRHHLRHIEVPERHYRRPRQRPLAFRYRPVGQRRHQLPLWLDGRPEPLDYRTGKRSGLHQRLRDGHGRVAGGEQYRPGFGLCPLQPSPGALDSAKGAGLQAVRLEYRPLRRRSPGEHPLRFHHRWHGREFEQRHFRGGQNRRQPGQRRDRSGRHPGCGACGRLAMVLLDSGFYRTGRGGADVVLGT